MNATTRMHHPAPTIPVVDPNGAGDAFISGILFGLQKKLPLLKACQLGEKAPLLAIQSFNSSFNLDINYVDSF